MKAFLLWVILSASALVMIMAAVLKPTLGQYFALASLLLLCQIMATYAAVYFWRPVGLSVRQVSFVIIGCMTIVIILVSVLAAWRQLPGLASALASDSTVQTEAALEYLSVGKNPYTEDYFATKLKDYLYDKYQDAPNPAFYHFVYLPSLLWLSYPLRQLSMELIGFFDQRFNIILAWVGLIWLMWSSLKKWPTKVIWLAPLLITNPWLVHHLIAGQNDMIPLFFVMAAILLWHKSHFTAGTIALAVAATTKQTVWFLLPFAFIYLWLRQSSNDAGRCMMLLKQAGWFAIVGGLLLWPFLWWDYSSLVQDTLGYILGTTTYTYPAWGLGLAEVLFRTGVIAARWTPFPFFVLQLLVGLPMMYVLLLKIIKARGRLSVVLASWTIWLASLWVVGRFFAPHHLGFLVSVAATAYFMYEVEDAHSRAAE